MFKAKVFRLETPGWGPGGGFDLGFQQRRAPLSKVLRGHTIFASSSHASTAWHLGCLGFRPVDV